MKTMQVDEAMIDIIKAIKLSPNDKALRTHHAHVKEGVKKAKEKEKGAFLQLFKYPNKEEQEAKKSEGLPKFNPTNS